MKTQQAQYSRKNFRIFGRSEYKELQKFLGVNEQVFMAAYGFYSGGSGLFVVTSSRVLLIDKQPFYVNVEDIRYEHITRVEIMPGKLQTTMKVNAGAHGLVFKSLSDARLKQMYHYIHARSELKTAYINQVIAAAEVNNPGNRSESLGMPRRLQLLQSSKSTNKSSVFQPLLQKVICIIPLRAKG